MATIRKTTNYKKFVYMIENRDIYRSNLKKLRESVSHRNLTEYNPVLVNENMEVIDGQHRIEVCKALKLPVYYIIVKGTGIEDVIRLNTAAKNWSLRDYIFSFIKRGYKDYESLRDLNLQHRIPYTLAAQILTGRYSSSQGNKSVNDDIRSGNFRIKDGKLAFAEGFCLFLNKFRKFAPLAVKNDRFFTSAIENLYRNQPKNIEGILRNLDQYAFEIKRMGTEKDYLSFFEGVYNWRRREKTRRRFFGVFN